MSSDLVVTNIAPFWDTITPYVAAIVGGFVAVATPVLNAWLQQHKCSAAQDDLDQALAHVPGLLATELASVAAHNPTTELPSAVASAARLIETMAPTAIAQLKISPAQVEQLVLGKLSAHALPAVPAASIPATQTAK